FDIAINNRLIFVALFSMAVLGAFGMDAWRDSGRDKELALCYALVAVVFVAVVAILWTWMRQNGLSREYLVEKSLLLVVPLLVAAMVLSVARARRVAFGAILLLLIMQRALESGHIYPTVPEHAFYPPVTELEALPRDVSPYRIVGYHHTLIPATATMYGLEDVRGYQAMTAKRWKNTYPLWAIHQPVWFNLVGDLTRPFLSFLNVRFAIAEPDTDAPEGWKVITGSDRMTLLENDRFIERAFVPDRIRLNVPQRDALSEMSLETDFSRRSWIDDPRRERLWGEAVNGPGQVTVRTPTMKRLDLTIAMQNAGWVVVSELRWKGWRAFRNGEPVPLHFANHAFLAVHVPRGEHQVTLVYWPRSFVTGAAVSGLTIVALLSWLLFRSWRGRRRRKQSSSEDPMPPSLSSRL
ncbi:MAG: YfhO family protein, partial [Acidobacteria bacterium]|nr:YfhO family protein [Acidobacteriota bacterium]